MYTYSVCQLDLKALHNILVLCMICRLCMIDRACTQLKLSQWNLSKEVTVLGSPLSIYVGQLKLEQVAVLDRCHCMINVHSIIADSSVDCIMA